MNTLLLSVVIPAYKEAENIKHGVLKEVSDFLSTQNYSWEVLIVNDGSPDDTLKLTREFAAEHKGFKVLDEPHRGKGGTVIAGMLAASGEIVLFTDMDQATPLSEFTKFLPKFESGYDVVIGSRSGRKGAPLTRKIMAFGLVILRTIILRLPFKDTQCGFKAFKREAAQKIFKKMKVFSEERRIKGAAVTAGFDIEFLYIARKMSLKIAEVPVVWRHRETRRVSPLIDIFRGIKDLLNIRLNAIRGKYK